jgi:hypothetical protein
MRLFESPDILTLFELSGWDCQLPQLDSVARAFGLPPATKEATGCWRSAASEEEAVHRLRHLLRQLRAAGGGCGSCPIQAETIRPSRTIRVGPMQTGRHGLLPMLDNGAGGEAAPHLERQRSTGPARGLPAPDSDALIID